MPSLPEFIPEYQNVIVLYWNMTEIIITTLLASGAAVGTSIPSSPSLCCESTVPSKSKKIARMLRHSLDRRRCCWCTCCVSSLTFRQADGSTVIQLVSEIGRAETLLVGAEAYWRIVSGGWGVEYSRPTFRRGDFNTHQTVLPPSVTDPCLPMGKKLNIITENKNTENFTKFEDIHLFFLNKNQEGLQKKNISDSQD